MSFFVYIIFQRFLPFFVYAKAYNRCFSLSVSIFKMEGVVGSRLLSVAFHRQETESKKYATRRHLDSITWFCIPYFKSCSTWINHLPFMGCLIHLAFNFSGHGFHNFHLKWKRQGFFKLSYKSCTILLLKTLSNCLTIRLVSSCNALHSTNVLPTFYALRSTNPNFCAFLIWITIFRGNFTKASLNSSWCKQHWHSNTPCFLFRSFKLSHDVISNVARKDIV